MAIQDGHCSCLEVTTFSVHVVDPKRDIYLIIAVIIKVLLIIFLNLTIFEEKISQPMNIECNFVIVATLLVRYVARRRILILSLQS